MPDYANPQSLNRYSYVVNNPLRYTDPTGHMMSAGDDGGKPKRCPSCIQFVQEKLKRHNDSTPTPTANPTYSSLLTSIPDQTYLNVPPTGTPAPGFVLNQAPSATPTASPSRTPLPLNLGVKSFVRDSVKAYGDGVWGFEEMVRPLAGNPDWVSKTIYVAVAGVETVGNWVAGVVTTVINSNGPSTNPNFITPTPSPTQPTFTAVPTATGVTPSITWTPSLMPTSTLTITPSVTPTWPTLTSTVPSTPVYWVP